MALRFLTKHMIWSTSKTKQNKKCKNNKIKSLLELTYWCRNEAAYQRTKKTKCFHISRMAIS